MSSYHCLVAGLPDVAFDGGKLTFSIDRFRDEIYPSLSASDAKSIDLFFLARDNENLLKILREGDEASLENIGLYTREELLEIINSAKNGDVRSKDIPSYLYDFLEYYFENEQLAAVLWSDVLSARYYEYAIASKNEFVSQWFAFNLNVNNLLVAIQARKHNFSAAEFVVGEGEIADLLRSSAARDFGLTGMFDYLEPVQRLSEKEELQERERMLDDMRWKWLDDNSIFNYFTIERIFVFLQKLDIVERWEKLDSDKGLQRFTELISNLKGGLELPAI